jgi:quinol monooxygenase YgiN
MTVEYIRYKVNPELKRSFVDAYASAARQLEDSPFCLAYELTECEEEDGQFILRIEWTSTEHHLNGFRNSAGFPEFFQHVKPFYNNIQEMRHYRCTGVYNKKVKQRTL